MKKLIFIASIILIALAMSIPAQRGRYAGEPAVLNAGTDVYFAVKTVIKTISVDDDASTDDFQFDDDAANANEQPVDMGAILPGASSVLSAQVLCIESVAGSGSAVMAVDLGTASGGAELLATQDIDAIGDLRTSTGGTAPEIPIAITAAGKNVWINATPDANWSTLTAGRWAVSVTYIDYGAVFAAKNP